MIILGIDPGLHHTGWGIIITQANHLSFVDCGIITTKPSDPLSERLCALHEGLTEVIGKHQPQEAAVEESFVNVNAASSLKLGQARGAILLTLSLAGLSVVEYSANLVKKSVVGKGHAEKAQVEHMVKLLLPGCKSASADAADALAVAITHAHHATLKRKT